MAQQPYPSRPITVLVPYAAGGFIDVVARLTAEGLSGELHQPVIVVNRAGANGKIALRSLVRADPDGYTFLVNNDGGIAVLQALDPDFQFEVKKDYAPVAQLGKAKYVLAVRGSLPVNNVKDLVEYARTNRVTFGSPGRGSIPHLSTEILARNAGVKMVHIPYPGAAPALSDLLSGQIDVLVNSVPGILGMVGSDQIKILAALSDERIALIPNVPTLVEAGMEPIQLGAWVGFFGPAGLPENVLAAITKGLQSAMNSPARIKRLKGIGIEPSFLGDETFPQVYAADVLQWRTFGQKYELKLQNSSNSD